MISTPFQFLFILSTVTSAAIEPVSIPGNVFDASAQVVSDAVVKLVETNCIDTTDNDGYFSIDCIPIGIQAAPLPIKKRLPVHLINDLLTIHLDRPDKVAISIFSLGGRLLETPLSATLPAGDHTVELGSSAVNVSIIRCRIGNRMFYYRNIRTLPHQTFSKFTIQSDTTSIGNRFSKSNTQLNLDNAMLEISHKEYALQYVPLSALRDTSFKITLVKANTNWITAIDKFIANQHALIRGLRNSNYAVFGCTNAPEGVYNVGFTILNKNGLMLSRNQYGSSKNEFCYTFAGNSYDDMRAFGSIIIDSADIRSGLYSLQLSPEGDSMNTTVFTSNITLNCSDGAISDDGGFVMTGYKSALDTVMNRTTSNVVVARFSPSGELLWNKEYTLGYYTSSNTIIQLTTGNFILSGYYRDTSALPPKPYLLHLDNKGDIINKIVIPDKKNLFFKQIVETSDNKVYILGTAPYSTRKCPYLARLSKECEIEWDTSFTDPNIRNIPCMCTIPDSTIMLACTLIPVRGSDTEMEFTRLNLLNITSAGEIVRELKLSDECGEPESISAGADGSLVVSSRVGNTFNKMKFYICNVSW